jgi:hypothetical protein
MKRRSPHKTMAVMDGFDVFDFCTTHRATLDHVHDDTIAMVVIRSVCWVHKQLCKLAHFVRSLYHHYLTLSPCDCAL